MARFFNIWKGHLLRLNVKALGQLELLAFGQAGGRGVKGGNLATWNRFSIHKFHDRKYISF
jgi:hypothetical protein